MAATTPAAKPKTDGCTKCGCELTAPKTCYVDLEIRPGFFKRIWAVFCGGCYRGRYKHGPRLRERLTCQ